MSSADKVAETRNTSIDCIPSHQQAIINRVTENVCNSGVIARIEPVDNPMPAFDLYNYDGRRFWSADLLASGPLVLSFLQGSWSPYCRQELDALQTIQRQIVDLGASLVVISPELPTYTAAVVGSQRLTYPILWDELSKTAETFGLVFTLPDDLKQVYRDLGADLSIRNGDPSWRLPVPARFVIDERDIIRSVETDPDYTHRSHPETTLAVLREVV